MTSEMFKIILWKNWIIQKRKWKSGIFEIIFPVLIVIFFTWEKSNMKFGTDDKVGILSVEKTNIYDPSVCFMYEVSKTVVISPKSPWIENFVREALKDVSNLQIVSYSDSKSLNTFLESNRSSIEKIYGIEFDDQMSVSDI